jgi:hypothetical protein
MKLLTSMPAGLPPEAELLVQEKFLGAQRLG